MVPHLVFSVPLLNLSPSLIVKAEHSCQLCEGVCHNVLLQKGTKNLWLDSVLDGFFLFSFFFGDSSFDDQGKLMKEMHGPPFLLWGKEHVVSVT